MSVKFTLNRLHTVPALSRSMFRDRAMQFIDRHHWDLKTLAGGLEIDEYDDHHSTYCIVADGDRHLASLRLRPEREGSMVERHFPGLWSGNESRLANGVEVTRFCTSPDLSHQDRVNAISDLLLGLCRHCQRSGIERIFGVVFPQAGRAIRQAGWASEVLAQSSDDRGKLMLAEWEVNSLTAWNIQERREFREAAHQNRISATGTVEREKVAA